LTFTHPITDIISKANGKINVLRGLAGTTWGQQKETLTYIYKQFIRTTIGYAQTGWFTTTSHTNRERLQRVQNTALRVITGCTRTTPIHHLHAETKIIPISDHLDMMGMQYFSRAEDPQHPNNYLHNLPPPPPPRQMKCIPAEYYIKKLNELPPLPQNTSKQSHIYTNSKQSIRKTKTRLATTRESPRYTPRRGPSSSPH